MASFIFGRSNKFKYSALMRHDALACSVVLLLLLAQVVLAAEFSSRDPSSDALRAPDSSSDHQIRNTTARKKEHTDAHWPLLFRPPQPWPAHPIPP